ncbi:MAG TPA: hypothetical protein VIM84_03800, partial [Gemmatimonadales bacterium]
MCEGVSGAAGKRVGWFRLVATLLRVVAYPLTGLPAYPLGALAILSVSATPAPAQGNADLEESRRRLDEIRAERDRLERQRERLQGQVHDVNDELTNLERQRESTQRIVSEIERQIGGLASQLDR